MIQLFCILQIPLKMYLFQFWMYHQTDHTLAWNFVCVHTRAGTKVKFYPTKILVRKPLKFWTFVDYVMLVINDHNWWVHINVASCFASLTTNIPYFINEIYIFPLSTSVITSLDKVISMVMKLSRGKITYEGCKNSKGHEASEPSFQP